MTEIRRTIPAGELLKELYLAKVISKAEYNKSLKEIASGSLTSSANAKAN